MQRQFLKLFLLLFFFSFFTVAFSQDCNLTLSGFIIDENTNQPLEFVNVYNKETLKGTASDAKGYFELKNICKGKHHFVFSHVSGENHSVFLNVEKDTILYVEIHALNTVLESVVISDKAITSTQNTQTLNHQHILDNSNQNLSNMLEEISGVSTLKNGNGISKPVVHGLYGNRLTILNNGIAQSGQQWGNDHAPEIDPLVANKIKVVKGVSSLEYQGSNLGSVILVEPARIEREPHLHGNTSYFFETNGRGHGINLQLEQFSPIVAWKINGTLKKSGDKKTPNYFLNNTGHQEANIAIQLEKQFTDNFFTELYFSSFNTELGILRGSHVGNLTDLENAFEREVPFFTEDDFSYAIDAPKQKVNHHLFKVHSKKYFDTKKDRENDTEQFLDFTFATQLNLRKEFDVRRSGRSEIPALSLKQYSYFSEIKYNKEFKNNLLFKVGLQSTITDNTNDPETGILPLIPDYLSYETGIFTVLTKKVNRWFFETGFRYQNTIQNAVTISRTVPREIIRFDNNFDNFSSSLGINYELSEHIQMSYNLGLATRNPAVNELFSNGLHQGVSGIEEGNPNLNTEKSIKNTFSLSGNIKEKLFFETLLYYQNIKDYIYLNPEKEFRLTIRGAFPVFKYRQTNAQMYGLDISTRYKFSKSLDVKANYSYIKGKDLENNLPLINMPSNNLQVGLRYQIQKPISIGNTEKRRKLTNTQFEITNRYVFRQNDLLAEQDFTLPPDGYNLVGLRVSTNIQGQKLQWRIFTKADNLFNIEYRDYLNRQRYFANDLGINVVLGVKLEF
ncbi:TonB-dependent receptor [Bernardetia sp.]|uniref:TonB-dependent receptor n=1 Tax=Bernardetia sp. TaxID=1937974 RepID=UPI0025BC724F|nr:TonB-dependent receptor [Bernardetia sp.]